MLKAFGDLYRRTFAALNNDGVVQGYARFILPMLGAGIDRALQRGAATTGPIRDFHWDFWPWIDRPLADVRRDLNVLEANSETRVN